MQVRRRGRLLAGICSYRCRDVGRTSLMTIVPVAHPSDRELCVLVLPSSSSPRPLFYFFISFLLFIRPLPLSLSHPVKFKQNKFRYLPVNPRLGELKLFANFPHLLQPVPRPTVASGVDNTASIILHNPPFHQPYRRFLAPSREGCPSSPGRSTKTSPQIM